MIQLMHIGRRDRYRVSHWLVPDTPLHLLTADLILRLGRRGRRVGVRLGVHYRHHETEQLCEINPAGVYLHGTVAGDYLKVTPIALDTGYAGYPLRLYVDIGMQLKTAAGGWPGLSTDRERTH